MASVDSENIWEVCSNGSHISLDDELARELEELDRKEEEEEGIESSSLNNGSAHNNGSSHLIKSECIGEPSSDVDNGTHGEEDNLGIVFKDTGEINVADCYEIDDSYKPKKASGVRYGLQGKAAKIATKERRKVRYQKKMMNPEYREKMKEYKKNYNMNLKKIRIKKITKKSCSSDAPMVLFPETEETDNSAVSLPACILANALKGLNKSLSITSKVSNGLPSSTRKIKQERCSIKDFAKIPIYNDVIASYKEDVNSSSSDMSSSDNSAPQDNMTVESKQPLSLANALKALHCSPLVGPDDGSHLLPGELVTPLESYSPQEMKSIYGEVDKMVEKASKKIYRNPESIYNSTPVSDEAQRNAAVVFKTLQMVSLKRYKHLQLLNKRLNSKIAYYQTAIRRDKHVIDLMSAELRKANRVVDTSNIKLPQFRLKRVENPDDDIMHRIDNNEAEAYKRLMKGLPVICKGQNSWKLETVLAPHELQRNNQLNGNVKLEPECEITEPKAKPLNIETIPVVSLKKINLNEHSAKVKNGGQKRSHKQVAMKSTAAGPKSKKSKKEDIKSDLEIESVDTESLRVKAMLEGKAFEDLKRKYCRIQINDVCASVKAEPVTNCITPSSRESPKPARFKIKRNFKSGMKKKIPRELIDENYVPTGKLKVIKSPSSDQKIVRDDVLYDNFILLKTRDQDYGSKVKYPVNISEGLKRKVLSFLDDAINYDKCLLVGSNDGGSEDGGSNGSLADGAWYGVNDGNHSESSVTSGLGMNHREQLAFVLHKRFIASHRDFISLSAFIELIPKSMGRKSTQVRGYSNCLSCGNAEIKFDCLLNQGHLNFKSNFDFEDIWLDQKVRTNLHTTLDKLSYKKDQMTNSSWVKLNKGNLSKSIRNTQDSIENVSKSLIQDLALMEHHIEQVSSKYLLIRSALERVQKSKNEAMIHISWCECPKVYHKSVNNHTMFDQCISLLCGYVWSGSKEYPFACVSDTRDHSTASLWTHLENPLTEMCNSGYKTFYIVSEPTTHQFRNKVLFYFINDFAVRMNIEIRWIFTVSYHSHLRVDFFSHKFKEMIERKTMHLVRMDGDNIYRSAHSMIDLLKDQLKDTRFFFIRSEDVVRNASSMPILQAIKGTQTFAEVFIAPEKFYVKLDSTDEYWTKVVIF